MTWTAGAAGRRFADDHLACISLTSQVPLTDISLMIIFVVVGIGVDDVIVVVDCLDHQTVDLPIPQRVSRALGEAGPAILL